MKDGYGHRDKWESTTTDKPCVGCGQCCKAQPCSLSDDGIACSHLRRHDGRYWCGRVEDGDMGATSFLLIGHGCGATYIPSKLKKMTLDARRIKQEGQ